MKETVTIIASIFAGFLGGTLGGRISSGLRSRPVEQVIRERTFELVDGSGAAISIWGVSRQRHTMLAFLGSQPEPDEYVVYAASGLGIHRSYR